VEFLAQTRNRPSGACSGSVADRYAPLWSWILGFHSCPPGLLALGPQATTSPVNRSPTMKNVWSGPASRLYSKTTGPFAAEAGVGGRNCSPGALASGCVCPRPPLLIVIKRINEVNMRMFIAARTSWCDCAGTSTGWRIESIRREGSDYTTQAVSGKEGDDAPGCMKVDCREGQSAPRIRRPPRTRARRGGEDVFGPPKDWERFSTLRC